jgi:predicted short-subunit dehydrogenase-like oxidoreductase (DUF2520 family)
VQIWSRNIAHAQELADTAHAQVISSLSDVVTDADLYIIAVPDNAVAAVAHAMPAVSGIVAHTSGSVNLQALANSANSHLGVFYPLQTFSKEKSVDFSEIPFFIEGSDETTAENLEAFAQRLSTKVYRADSAQRATLHLAAVFACNFANHLWSIAADTLSEANYSFDIFKPLLQETLNKAIQLTPAAAQTGPARRGDMNIINAQLAKLDGDKRDLYELITNMIIAKHHEQNKF